MLCFLSVAFISKVPHDLPLRARAAAFDEGFRFLERGRARVAGRGHGQRAVGGTVIYRLLRVVEFHEVVDQAARKAVAAAPLCHHRQFDLNSELGRK